MDDIIGNVKWCKKWEISSFIHQNYYFQKYIINLFIDSMELLPKKHRNFLYKIGDNKAIILEDLIAQIGFIFGQNIGRYYG